MSGKSNAKAQSSKESAKCDLSLPKKDPRVTQSKDKAMEQVRINT